MSIQEFFKNVLPGKWGIQQYLNNYLRRARQKNQFDFGKAIKYYLLSLNAIIKDAPGSHRAGFAQMLLDKYRKKVRTYAMGGARSVKAITRPFAWSCDI